MKGFCSIENCDSCYHNGLNVSSLSEIDIDILNTGKREMDYNKGETIIKQGLYVSHIVYLRKGLIKLVVEGVNGKNHIIKFIPSGNFVDFSIFDSKDYYSYTAVAVKKSSVCLIKQETLEKLINNNYEINQKIISWYGEDYRFLYKKFAMLGTKNTYGRFAETLLYLCTEEFENEDIFKHITRKEIAELSGMSVESMLKTMQELKADNIIKVKGKKIEIQDFEMIKRLSRIG